MAAGDITNLGDLKAWLGINNPSDDGVLGPLISNVSKEIYNRCGRQANGFTAAGNVTETRNGTGTASISVLNFPINSVASVVVDDQSLPASPDGVLPGYVFDPYTISLVGFSGGYVRGIGLPWPSVFCFTQGRGNVVLTYNAGFSAIPSDLAQDCIEICALKYQARKHIGLRSNSSKSGESSTFNTSEEIDRIFKRIEGRYRRFGIS